MILQPREDDGLGCDNGCGEWIARAVVLRLLGTDDITTLGNTAPHFKVTPLPPTRCLSCFAPLVAGYRAIDDADPLTLGSCRAHGVWVESRVRRDLERAYEAAIASYRRADTLADTLADKLRAGGLKGAAHRILRLEARISELEAQIADLERRVPWWR